MSEQEKIVAGSVNTDSISGTVYTVTVRWMDSPHPECVGVFLNETDADAKLKDCASKWSEPKPVVAWEKNEVEIE